MDFLVFVFNLLLCFGLFVESELKHMEFIFSFPFVHH